MRTVEWYGSDVLSSSSSLMAYTVRPIGRRVYANDGHAVEIQITA